MEITDRNKLRLIIILKQRIVAFFGDQFVTGSVQLVPVSFMVLAKPYLGYQQFDQQRDEISSTK